MFLHETKANCLTQEISAYEMLISKYNWWFSLRFTSIFYIKVNYKMHFKTWNRKIVALLQTHMFWKLYLETFYRLLRSRDQLKEHVPTDKSYFFIEKYNIQQLQASILLLNVVICLYTFT